MPSYDIECFKCGFETVEILKIADLNQWDAEAACPQCEAEPKEFRRVIRMAPANYGGEKSQAKSQISKKSTAKALFSSSGERDAMRHRESQTRDKHQVAAAVESVRKGEFEGF